jgi:hypothetical protein
MLTAVVFGTPGKKAGFANRPCYLLPHSCSRYLAESAAMKSAEASVEVTVRT